MSIDRIDRRARLPRAPVAYTSTHGYAGDGTRADDTDGAEPGADPEAERPRVDPVTHRVDVVRRLVARGVTVRALEALLPGWEGAIAQMLEDRDAEQRPDPDQLDPQNG